MINFNGNIVDESNQLSNNRGFLFGDAVFETLRVISNHIPFWEDHYFRLMASMRVLRFNIPDSFTPEFLKNEILKLQAKIRKDRQEQIYAQQEMQAHVLKVIGIVIASIVFVLAVVGLIWLLMQA